MRFIRTLIGILFSLLVISVSLLWILSSQGLLGDFIFNGSHAFPLFITGVGVLTMLYGILVPGNFFEYVGTIITIVGLGLILPSFEIVPWDYAGVLPFVLAAPCAASVVTFLVGNKKKLHLKLALFFGILAAYTALSNLGFIQDNPAMFWIVLVLIAGVLMLINFIFGRGKRWDDADNERDYRRGKHNRK